MSEIILHAHDLSKTYVHEGIQNHVIKHLNLEIIKGDFTVIMGPSGSGKSTLLYCLSAMEEISGGSVYFHEQDITEANENQLSDLRLKHFGFVFQQIHLVSSLTLLENILISGLSSRNRRDESVYERGEELLRRFQTFEAKDRLPSQVSGGEAQRAAIARALINGPELLFADEPTGSLNQRNSQIVLDLFTELNVDGQSIVMVTHDRKAALRANRIVYLIDGRIVGDLGLTPYQDDDLSNREVQLNTWLESMSW
ncbi:MAG: ABC transporter ATP-binding protein [Clostridiaceae bacterium]|nr:ABC transporter ATP-binding protein [Clostridiaceae bacterium]